MPTNKAPLSDFNRTPSPGKAEAEDCRKHSPWTAPRARKKNRSSPCKLPDVQESTQEDKAPPQESGGEGEAPSTVARNLQLLRHTLLQPSMFAQPGAAFQAVSAVQDSGAAFQAVSAVQDSNKGDPVDFGPFSTACTERSPRPCPLVPSTANLSWQQPEQHAHLLAKQNPFMSSTSLALSGQMCAESSGGISAAPGAAADSAAVAPIGIALINCPAVAVADSDHVTVGQNNTTSSQGALAERPTANYPAAVVPVAQLQQSVLQVPAHIVDLAEAAEDLEEAGVTVIASTPFLYLPKGNLQVSTSARGPAGGTSSPTQHWTKLAIEGLHSQAANSNLADDAEEQGMPSPQMYTGKGARQELEVATPSPDMVAPGSRPKLDGKAPPRVPTSCRTIRRVRISSPTPTEANAQRKHDIRPSSGDAMSDDSRSGLRFDSPAATDDEHRPMSVERPASQRTGRSFRTSFGAVDELQPMEDLDNDESSNDDCSPDFVLSRGEMTPGVYVPGYDDEEDGSSCEMAPVKGSSGPSGNRAGQLSTFNDRLHEAVQNGDAVTVGQAWQDVRRGILQPDDIDVLNTLLKGYCKVQGDPEEAEQVVIEACREGRITPNASTYHHMATLWTRHEQLTYPR